MSGLEREVAWDSGADAFLRPVRDDPVVLCASVGAGGSSRGSTHADDEQCGPEEREDAAVHGFSEAMT
jgi:hypothetical protein